ncbi:MAG: hypothetical protein AMJ81_13675 [Phycisphaerae bacterium SM23_33]|nr:MAG: hypothetical protein AMJ81_13675 [Phycisphaerae bacterium SM23_33]
MSSLNAALTSLLLLTLSASAALAADIQVRHAGAPEQRPVFDVGDKIEVVCTSPPGTKVTARWMDSYGRLVAESGQTAGEDGKARFVFPVRAVVSTGNRMEVLVGQKPLAEPVKFGCTPQHTRPLRDWYTFPWAAYPIGTGDALRGIGCNGNRGYGHEGHRASSQDPLVENDLRYYVDELLKPIAMPRRIFTLYKKNKGFLGEQMKPFLDKWNEQGIADHSTLGRRSCLSDPDTIRRMSEMARRVVSWQAPYKPIWYNMQDEGGMAAQNQKNEFCYSEHCLAGFRQWIRGQYPSLDALNTAWQTKVRSWDEVTPMTSYEIAQRDKGVAVPEKRLGPWCDHRAYMDVVMLRALATCREVGRRYDPDGLFGMTGTQGPSPWPGFDYSQLPKVLDIAHYYDYNNAIEIARSFHARYDKRLFPYPGWFAGAKRCRYDWYYLFHGLACTGLWDIDQELLDKQGRPTAKGLGLKDTWLELQRGIGRLFINAKRDNDPIGIHFSQPTRRVWAIVDRDPAFQGQTWAWDDSGSMRILEDLGFQYEFVGYQEVEEGLLAKGKFRLHFMNDILALSDAEAKAITDWVRAGGVLVLDKWVGTFDQHGRGRAQPALADLTAGKAEQKQEDFDVFACGRGKVVLLHKNVLLARYPTHRLTGGESVAAMKAMFGKLLALAGLKARVPALDEKGDCHHGVEVVLFADGPARYAAVLFNSGYDGRIRTLRGDSSKLAVFDKPSRVTVRFDGKREVYNIRAGKHLGKAESDTATLDPVAPLCYALLPYRVTGVDVQVAASAGRGQIVPVRCTVTTAGDGAIARHVLRVDVLGPDGSLRTYYSRNLDAAGGEAEMTIPLALNDATGAWRLRVKDIATGTTAEKTFQVE